MRNTTPRDYIGAIRFKKSCRLYKTMPLQSPEPNRSVEFTEGVCFLDCLVSYPKMYGGSQCTVSYPDGSYTFNISASCIEYVSDRVALIDNILADMD